MDKTKTIDFTEKFKASAVKKTNNKTEQRPTMTERTLPVRDFELMLNHNKVYLGTLYDKKEMLNLRYDTLNRVCESILSKQSIDTLRENSSMLLEWSSLRKECLDVQNHINIHEKILQDCENHYNKVTLVQFKKQSEKCEKNFDKILAKAKEVREELKNHEDEKIKGISKAIDGEIYWFEALRKEQLKGREGKEYRLMLYNALKRLTDGYDKLKNENKITIGK